MILLFSGLFGVHPIVFAEEQFHVFSIDSTKHNLYGLTYPITYEFSIPSGSSNLQAYKRFSLSETWVQIVKKTNSDYFNGIEAVRFDYANNRAYVSISFASYSDFIYLSFRNVDETVIDTSFLDVTEYYDNREVAVTFTMDDLGLDAPWGGDENITKASIAFANAKVWWTGGVTTEWVEYLSSWDTMQEAIDRGYLEMASHSRTHPSSVNDYSANDPPYVWEIEGSKDDIMSHLDLPYKKGSQEYVWCWIEPSGYSDETVQETLGEYNYLVSRRIDLTYRPTYYEEWNSDYGLYDRAYTTSYMDLSYYLLEELNDEFDLVYNLGGIYHAWGHVGQIGWDPGMKGYEHIQHVKGKNDVWYVGFGHLYAYHFTSQNVIINESPVADADGPYSGTEGSAISFDGSGSYDPDGTIVSYLWNFGDGQTSTQPNPTHVYVHDGTYSVSLTVTDDYSGLDVDTTSADVVDLDPVADFSASPTSGDEPLFVTFTDQSTSYDGIVSWLWNFGDGATSNQQNPTHNYNEGVFTVSLRVTDSDGDFDTETKTGYITVTAVNLPPVADFSASPVSGFEPLSVSFSDASISGDGIVSWLWSFGDGGTSSAQNPTHVYDVGTYTVSLTVTESDSDFDIETKTGYITVKNIGLPPVVEGLQSWYWTGDTVINSVAEADVDDDGAVEIVTGGYYNDGELDVAQLVVWDGATLAVDNLAAWYWTGDTRVNSVAVGNLDGDNALEIVTGGYYFDGTRRVAQLVVWDGATMAVDGLASWYWTGDTEILSVKVADVDDDGSVEVVTGGYFNDLSRDVAQLVVWSSDLQSVENLATWYWTGDTRINSVDVGNLDADAQLEIVTGGYFNDNSRDVAQLVAWDGETLAVDGLSSWYWTDDTRINSVTVGNVDADGQLEIVTGGYFNDNSRDVAQLVVWSSNLQTVENLASWYWTGDTRVESVCVGDVDVAGGDVEIVTGGYHTDGQRIAQLAVWDGELLGVESVRAWYWTGDTQVNSVAVGNVDADAYKEIVTGGYYDNGVNLNAQLVVWAIQPELPKYTLTVNVVEGGSVALDPDQATYTSGSSVQLTATADSGWEFSGWSGDLISSANPETLVMDGDKSVTASFTEVVPEYTLTVNVVEGGSVALDPDQATYTSGSSVQLTATADSGWEFSGWSGDLISSANPETLVMDGDKSVTATFTEIL